MNSYQFRIHDENEFGVSEVNVIVKARHQSIAFVEAIHVFHQRFDFHKNKIVRIELTGVIENG